MAYDLLLGDRIRLQVHTLKNIIEKNMFGGIAFMKDDKMFCGVIKNKLVVRVDPSQMDDLLSEPFTSPMSFTGKPMKSFLFVDSEGLSTDKILADWINLSLSYVKTLPAKKLTVKNKKK